MRWLRFPRVLGVACCLYFLVMTAVFGSWSVENTEFSATAREVTGTVIALTPKPLPGGRIPSGRHRDEPLAPTVRFTVDDRAYTYTPARGRRKPTVKIGSTVQILYDATDPKATARIKGEGAVALPLITLGFFGSAVGLAVVLVRTRPGRLLPSRQGRRSVPDQGRDRPAVSAGSDAG